MVKGKTVGRLPLEKPSLNYRKLDALNQSMIAKFDEKPVQFFREYKMGEPRKIKESTAFTIGDMVDFYLLECQGDEQVFENRFDEKFALMDGVKGGGQAFELADILFQITVANLSEDGTVNLSFTSRFEEAYEVITKEKDKYKEKSSPTGYKSIDKVLEDFDKNGKAYFQKKIDNIGKTVVDSSLVDKAKKVANNLKSDEFTKHIFIEGKMEVFTHFPIEWKYDLDENRYIDCKSELDMIKIDHDRKVIYPIDLKTTFDNELFINSYIKNYYYIQNAFYTLAIGKWADENNMKDYQVQPMQFVVGDTSANNRRPLIYKTDAIDFQRGLEGFSLRGVKCRGVNELIHEIAWCEENSIWNCSKESYDNKGQMKLNIQYD